MIIRTTEREHQFTKALFEKLNLFSIQGLTLDVNKNFSAGIEAIQYDDNETIELAKIFPEVEVKAKYYLVKRLNIPFYYMIFKMTKFYIYEVLAESTIDFKLANEFYEEAFVKWWFKLKGLSQPKPLMEASARVKSSIFDNTLEKYGMAWGGNIDGFMFKNKDFSCIIENIYTQRHSLDSPRGEPSYYFHMRGPNYNTWFPTVKLAMQLNVPLFLFTIEGNNNKERIGFSVIDRLDKTGVYYRGKKPNENILEGIDKIVSTINESLKSLPPSID